LNGVGYRDIRDAIDIVYKSIQADKEAVDITDIMRELHQIVDGSIVTQSTAEPKPDDERLYDISKIDFERLRKEFAGYERKNTVTQSLKEAVEQKLSQLMMQNPLRTDYQEHYENLVKEYNQEKDRVLIEQTFEALFKYYQDLTKEEQRAAREGLDEERLAIVDLIQKTDLKPSEIKKIKKVATELLATLKENQLKVANWKSKESTRDAVKQKIYDYLYDEKTGLPVGDYDDDEIKLLSEKVFVHVYRAYPTVPSPIYN